MKQKLADAWESFATIIDNLIEGIKLWSAILFVLALGGGAIFVCLLILRAIADFVLRR